MMLFFLKIFEGRELSSKLFWNDSGAFYRYFNVFLFLLPLGLPGGDQVDGLPPAASTDWSSADARVTTEVFMIFGRFFEFFWVFSCISNHF